MSTAIMPAAPLAEGFHAGRAGRPLVHNQRRYVVLASIWPLPLTRAEMHYSQTVGDDGAVKTAARTVYDLPAGAESRKDALREIRLLRVYDSYIRRLNPETQKYEALPLYCASVADGLVSLWSGVAGGAASGSAMGLMVLEGDEPNDAEARQLLMAQQAYFTQRVMAAEEYYLKGELHRIGDVDRMAARWLNQHTRMKWCAMANAEGMKDCIGCRTSLPAKAITCANCGDLVAKALDGYWTPEELKQEDPYLYDRWRDISARARDRERKRKKGETEDGE